MAAAGDLAVTIMLASITLLLAWSGFQASKWGGVQAINFSDAGKARTDSNALTDIGGTLTSIDVALFVAWLEEAEPALAVRDIPAATTGEGLAPFLYQSFPDRLEVAVEETINSPTFMCSRPLCSPLRCSSSGYVRN